MKRIISLFLVLLLVLVFLAVPTLAEEPTSHVTESSGNGYALYNGVKLPNIDFVWDKESYPYAVIFTQDDLSNAYYLAVSDVIPFVDDSEIYWENSLGLLFLLDLDTSEDNWVEDSDAESFFPITLVWSNCNVPDYDGNLLLSASSSIPLDGMTVIEWDGVTDGLEELEVEGGTVFKVTDSYVDISEDTPWHLVMSINGVLNYIDSANADFEKYSDETYTSWSIGSNGYAVVGSTSDPDTPYFGFGFGFLVLPTNYPSLFAYTPAGSEPDTPVPDLESPTVSWSFIDRELIVSEYHPIVAIGNIGADGQCVLYSRSLNSDGTTSEWTPYMTDEVMKGDSGIDMCAFDLYPDDFKVPYSMQYKAVVTLGSGTNTVTAETDVLTIHWVKSSTVDPTEPTIDGGGSSGDVDSDDDVPMLQAIWQAITDGFNNVGVWFSAQLESMSTWGQSIKDSIDALPDKIAEALSGMFVPSEGAIEDMASDAEEMVADRFGAVYEGAQMIDQWAGQLSVQTARPKLTVPAVTVNLAGVPFSFGGWDVDVIPKGFEFLAETCALVIDIIATLAFLNSLKHRLERTLEG